MSMPSGIDINGCGWPTFKPLLPRKGGEAQAATVGTAATKTRRIGAREWFTSDPPLKAALPDAVRQRAVHRDYAAKGWQKEAAHLDGLRSRIKVA